MATQLIVGPGEWVVRGVVPPKGRVHFRVEANAPINIFITDEEGRDKYRLRLELEVYASVNSVVEWSQKVYLPPGIYWYLIMQCTEGNRAVYCEVY